MSASDQLKQCDADLRGRRHYKPGQSLGNGVTVVKFWMKGGNGYIYKCLLPGKGDINSVTPTRATVAVRVIPLAGFEDEYGTEYVQGFKARIIRETRILRDLNFGSQAHGCNQILNFYDCFMNVNQDLCVVTEDIDECLGDVIGNAPGKLRVGDVVSVMFQLSEALIHLRGRRVVHKSINADNILVAFRPSFVPLGPDLTDDLDFVMDTRIVIKLADFGRVKRVNWMKTGLLGETNICTKRDTSNESGLLWSLGAVMHRMVHGHPPVDPRIYDCYNIKDTSPWSGSLSLRSPPPDQLIESLLDPSVGTSMAFEDFRFSTFRLVYPAVRRMPTALNLSATLSASPFFSSLWLFDPGVPYQVWAQRQRCATLALNDCELIRQDVQAFVKMLWGLRRVQDFPPHIMSLRARMMDSPYFFGFNRGRGCWQLPLSRGAWQTIQERLPDFEAEVDGECLLLYYIGRSAFDDGAAGRVAGAFVFGVSFLGVSIFSYLASTLL